MNWLLTHVRTQRVFTDTPVRGIPWSGIPFDIPMERLHGRSFILTVPQGDQEQAEALLSDLDRWADVMDMSYLRRDTVLKLIQEHVREWARHRRAIEWQMIEWQPDPSTPVVVPEHCPGCGPAPTGDFVVSRCRDHEVSMGGSADRRADAALQTSELIAAFAPGMTWADINRRFCSYIHRNREKLEPRHG